MGRRMKAQTDIVFIVSPNNWSSYHPPFYFMALAAWLEREGYNCEIIDEKVSWNLLLIISEEIRNKAITRRAINKIKKFKPRYIGLAAFITDYNVVMEMAREIKKTFNIPIIIGNAQVTVSPKDFIYEGSPIDYAVVGEGEITLTELITTLGRKGDIRQVNGLAYLDNGKAYFTPKRALISDLNVLPMPAYHKINMKYYTQPRLYLIRYVPVSGIAIYTGRGCPFQCEFCCSNLIWKSHDNIKFVRTKSIDMVIEELRFLKRKFRIQVFYILDDTFTISKERTLQFCHKLIESNLSLLWGAETRVNLMDEDMIKLMKESGCIQLDFGVESGSKKLLDKIKKGITTEEISRAFKLCKENGIRTFANMLLNLPEETEQDLRESERLLDEIEPTVASFAVTVPYPGTALYEKYIPQKPSKEEYNLFRNAETNRFRMAAHHLRFQEVLKALQREYEITNPEYFLRSQKLRKKVFKSAKILNYFKESLQFIVLQKLGCLKEKLEKFWKDYNV